ncbi:fumarate hydratase [Candidatus Desantisbacteria bacterium CG1_02_38_46]|uniref:Fumarate hydratase n=2 Tax=unclassified Candidatus Desantisiibacteriota TaxID=3106372 RepID=A0A2H9PCS1_9BACT|nr:MAG: fumarate hydratase [Candidatus Desantisbacteria bacterium CG1_02_38_46]PIZ17095.1 MAG: fumarate hydratase [Candidatus Desantisbacteria bacterium CG_4_10_14_0_8_um_filter_39_17]
MRKIKLPLEDKVLNSLKIGEIVLLNGIIYTARDAAHKRMIKKLPFDIRGQVIYYAGPTPAPPGRVIGSCGPTTSARMDIYTPLLLKMGLKGMIGKGNRSSDVIKATKKYKAIYFVAIGGAGALLSKKIKSAKIIAYRNLGPEAIYKLEVEDFPVIVGIDSFGKNIFKKSSGRVYSAF